MVEPLMCHGISRIAGSPVIQRAMRLCAPLPVPQTWDPPLVARFAIEN